jgi:hypothetical protein
MPPSPDCTTPQDDAARQRYVQELMDVMIEVDETKIIET